MNIQVLDTKVVDTLVVSYMKKAARIALSYMKKLVEKIVLRAAETMMKELVTRNLVLVVDNWKSMLAET